MINKRIEKTYVKKPFAELSLIDDFMFDVATVDIETCKDIVELCLNIQISEIRWKEGQKVVHNRPDKRGIRLDFYVVDLAGKVFNVEMQKYFRGDLRKRSRFYSAMLDTPLLKSGEENFDALPPTYIIFICGFDPFGYGKFRYTFERRCREMPELCLEDETRMVFLSTKGRNEAEVEPSLPEFLRFVEDSSEKTAEHVRDERVRRMYRRVCSLKKSEEMEVSYMTTQERDRWIREEGYNEMKYFIVGRMKKKGFAPEAIAEMLEESVADVEAMIGDLEKQSNG